MELDDISVHKGKHAIEIVVWQRLVITVKSWEALRNLSVCIEEFIEARHVLRSNLSS